MGGIAELQSNCSLFIPAKAGIHLESSLLPPAGWIPAFAGMTGWQE
jgi:hypothetical protein